MDTKAGYPWLWFWFELMTQSINLEIELFSIFILTSSILFQFFIQHKFCRKRNVIISVSNQHSTISSMLLFNSNYSKQHQSVWIQIYLYSSPDFNTKGFLVIISRSVSTFGRIRLLLKRFRLLVTNWAGTRATRAKMITSVTWKITLNFEAIFIHCHAATFKG